MREEPGCIWRGRSAASSAAHRAPGTLISWCMFDCGGAQEGLRVSRVMLLASLCLHIPGRGGASLRGAVAMRPLRQGKPWGQHVLMDIMHCCAGHIGSSLIVMRACFKTV